MLSTAGHGRGRDESTTQRGSHQGQIRPVEERAVGSFYHPAKNDRGDERVFARRRRGSEPLATRIGGHWARDSKRSESDEQRTLIEVREEMSWPIPDHPSDASCIRF